MGYLPSSGCVIATIWMHHLHSIDPNAKKLRGNYTRRLPVVLNKQFTKQQLYSRLPPTSQTIDVNELDMLCTAGEVRNSLSTSSNELLHTGSANNDTSSVQTRGALKRT